MVEDASRPSGLIVAAHFMSRHAAANTDGEPPGEVVAKKQMQKPLRPARRETLFASGELLLARINMKTN